MERKFSFDDMKFVAKAERVDGALRVGIFDAWDECRLEADYPAAAPKAKGKGKAKSAAAASADEEKAIDHLITAFKKKVEDGEIDLA